MSGRFIGKLSDRLNIAGIADRDTFYALCDNINPATGGNLTPRTKEERTTGYDLNFHCPKSVSVLSSLMPESGILQVFEASVMETLEEVENDSMTRVRKGGKDENRQSGELAIGLFTHLTARPVDNKPPDPHLHAHAYIFNATFDPVEKKIKAAQFRDIKRDCPYYQARFQKRLSDKLIDLGYRIRVTEKAFEIDGVPQGVIDLFSKRTNEIGQYAKEHGITDPAALSELGAKTRAKKQGGLSMNELRTLWRQQIKDNLSFTDAELDKSVRYGTQTKEQKMIVQDCVDHTIEHSYERASVMQDRRLLANAIKYSIGERHIDIEAIEQATPKDNRLIYVTKGHLTYCTTNEALSEEREMVQLARKGQGRLKPLYAQTPAIKYDGDQGAAIEHVLTTSNQTSIIRGVAGAGKTTALLELDRLIEATGTECFFFTPMAQTAREQMPSEGFKKTDTIARLLGDRELQEKLKGKTIFIDEAGQVPVGDMNAIFKIADKQNARLVLVGDPKQHNPVMKGDALRVINKIGGIHTAEVSKIYRQRTNPQYLAAVEDLSKGNIAAGFEKLDEMGAITIIDPLKPNEEIADHYVKTIKKGKTALIVSPTHKQGQAVTKDIRQRLREVGIIGKREIAIKKLENLNFTEAQKIDWRNYQPGQIIQFNQNIPKIPRGSIWRLNEVSDNAVTIDNEAGETHNLPLERAKHFNVYRQSEIQLSKGDQIKITNGGFDVDDKRLNNGQMMDVVKITKEGDIHLINNVSKSTYTINNDFGHIDHAYCSTSHSAQGKTVDVVLISQPADTFSATNAKQLYVSVSRGKSEVKIFTDDKEKLLEHALQIGDRTSAMELVGELPEQHDHIIRHEISRKAKSAIEQPGKEYLAPELNSYYEDYEPRL